MIKQVKIKVSGRVQGVGFRFFTHSEMCIRDRFGYVKNLDNGDVEILVQGDSLQITNFTQWLNQGGPASARINNIDICELIPENGLTSFNIRY